MTNDEYDEILAELAEQYEHWLVAPDEDDEVDDEWPDVIDA